MSAEPVSSSGAPGPLPVTRAGVLGPPGIEIKRMGRTVWQREGFIKAKAGCIKGVHCGGEWIWYPVVHGHSGLRGSWGLPAGRSSFPFPLPKCVEVCPTLRLRRVPRVLTSNLVLHVSH